MTRAGWKSNGCAPRTRGSNGVSAAAVRGGTIPRRADRMTEARPKSLREFAIVPNFIEQLKLLAELAEPEEWGYKTTPTTYELPILYNYIQRTFVRIQEQDRIEVSPDREHSCWNTGLVTNHQEPILTLFDRNLKSDQPDQPPWHFRRFCRQGEFHLNYFGKLPDMATYFDDPGCLVFDSRRELRVNVDHIIEDNKERFPGPFCTRSNFELQMLLNGAISNAGERVRRNYKAAVPQF